MEKLWGRCDLQYGGFVMLIPKLYGFDQVENICRLNKIVSVHRHHRVILIPGIGVTFL